MKLKDRVQHAWNAFSGNKMTDTQVWNYGAGSGQPSHKPMRRYTSSSFSAAIFNRIAMDVATSAIHHVKIDADNDDRTTVTSGLHNCLTVEANLDQTSIQFMQDIVYSMFDEGSVAIVPVDTTVSPNVSGSYEINTMRVGRISQWFPKHVEVKLYNEITGSEESVTLPKSMVAIVENPLYAVINGPNATLSRLLRKMSMVDNLDEMVSSGRLDLLVKLPYAVKTELQQAQAEERVKKLEAQLHDNKYGIAYTDASESVTQLNRPVDNKMSEDIKFLSQQFYNQLGLTESIFNGTASETEMRSYYTRTIDPILNAIIAEFNRKFLTKTARTQGQTLEAYRDPFSLVPVEQIAKIADTFRRNSILTSNELRGVMGYRRSNDPKADELFNPNIADKNQETAGADVPGSLAPPDNEPDSQNE